MNHVLITGASSGIGRQLALDYAAEGWKVTACGRDPAKLEALNLANPAIDTLSFDMTDLALTRQALAWVQASLVILCAGTCEYLDSGVVDAEKVTRVLNTNVLGPVNCLDALLPGLPTGARVVLVGSTASLVPLPRAEAYGASKAALAYFARSLSLDLAPRGIQVSLVMPGFVKTPLTERNNFPMPMMISVEQASQCIRKGLARGAAEIAFPLRFVWLLKTVALLPFAWQKRLAQRLVR
ncbi:short-chain dehydrogenase [Enterobacterales bacterium]|nr:short-chain dehydrogenase [Enterobacterales bacterium]